MNEYIQCSERMPDFGQEVIWVYPNGNKQLGSYQKTCGDPKDGNIASGAHTYISSQLPCGPVVYFVVPKYTPESPLIKMMRARRARAEHKMTDEQLFNMIADCEREIANSKRS